MSTQTDQVSMESANNTFVAINIKRNHFVNSGAFVDFVVLYVSNRNLSKQTLAVLAGTCDSLPLRIDKSMGRTQMGHRETELVNELEMICCRQESGKIRKLNVFDVLEMFPPPLCPYSVSQNAWLETHSSTNC
jgi:hypothetical protein